MIEAMVEGMKIGAGVFAGSMVFLLFWLACLLLAGGIGRRVKAQAPAATVVVPVRSPSSQGSGRPN